MIKIFLSTLLVFLTFTGATYAQTYWTGSVADFPGNFTADNVQAFDWSESGSGNAEGVGPDGAPLDPGKIFTFRYQGFLFALLDPDGQSVQLPGLNSGLEYTLVAEFDEIVIYFDPDANLAVFSTLSNGKFYIYWDGSENADNATGEGFDDGTLVASGSISPGQTSFFRATGPNEGQGSFVIEGLVDYANPDFLAPDTIFDIRLEGNLNLPAGTSDPDAFFVSRTGEGNLAPYTVTVGEDLSFKADASSKFSLEETTEGDCRVTAGGVKEVQEELVTYICSFKPNGQIDPKTCAKQDIGKKLNLDVSFKDIWGGQAGASGIDGNWTHHHQVSPQKKFTFHSNDVFNIECSDPGVPCTPAGANAETRQIDFKGIGRFTNQKGFDFPEGDLCYFVHLEDIGEPGPGGKWPSSDEQCLHVPGTPINNATDCMNCTDYYEVRIFGNTDCTGDPIYANGDPSLPSPLGGYFITSGNVQMHSGK